MKASPLAKITEKFGSKADLVKAVQDLATDALFLDRVSAVKGLGRVSNAKLLALHTTLVEVKDRFGSRAKLIDAILEKEKKVKDVTFRERLEAYPTPRLYDFYRGATRREKHAAKRAA